MIWKIRFTVEGAPKTKGSWRFLGRGVVVADNPKSVSWEKCIKGAAWVAKVQSGLPAREFEGRYPVDIDLFFSLARPDSHVTPSGVLRKGYPVQPIFDDSGDIDKLTRCALDAMEGVFYRNDAQVASLHVSKVYSRRLDKPGLVVILSGGKETGEA